MKPKNVRERISSIKEQMRIEEILLKTYKNYRDCKNHNERISKQKAIILEAEKTIALIRHERDIAKREIAKIKQNMRWEEKQLTKLKNWDKIEKLKKLAKDLEEARKETEDGKKHGNA